MFMTTKSVRLSSHNASDFYGNLSVYYNHDRDFAFKQTRTGLSLSKRANQSMKSNLD